MKIGDFPIHAELLSPDAIAAELARRAARHDLKKAARSEPQVAVLLWSIGQERYATPLADIWTTLAPARLTAVPGAPARLLGIFARQGVVHNLFDPAPALGAAAGAAAGYRMIVLRQDRPRIALRVDAVHEIVEVAAREYDDRAEKRRIVIDDGAVTLVDTQALIARLIGRAIPGEG